MFLTCFSTAQTSSEGTRFVVTQAVVTFTYQLFSYVKTLPYVNNYLLFLIWN